MRPVWTNLVLALTINELAAYRNKNCEKNFEDMSTLMILNDLKLSL